MGPGGVLCKTAGTGMCCWTGYGFDLSVTNRVCIILRESVLNWIYVVVQFYPWFKFYFLLFQTHYYTLERFSLDCRKTKTKVNTLANQRA